MTTRKGISLVILTATLTGVFYLFFYEPSYSGLIKKDERPGIYAHRGFGDFAPDNALVSAHKAMQEGMDGIDVDGQITKDGQIVIYHDLSVDRLTHGTGKVANLTLDELTTLDLNESFGDTTYDGAFVAPFEDFVREITPDGILMVELKVPSAKKSGIEQEAVRIIEKYDAFNKVYLSSFNPLVLYRLKKSDSRVRTALIFMDTNWNVELRKEIKPEDFVPLPWPLQQEWSRRAIRKIIKPDLLSVNVEVAEKTRARLLEKGWPIFLWTIDDSQDITDALSDMPHGIITDQPLRAKTLRDQLNP